MCIAFSPACTLRVCYMQMQTCMRMCRHVCSHMSSYLHVRVLCLHTHLAWILAPQPTPRTPQLFGLWYAVERDRIELRFIEALVAGRKKDEKRALDRLKLARRKGALAESGASAYTDSVRTAACRWLRTAGRLASLRAEGTPPHPEMRPWPPSSHRGRQAAQLGASSR